MEERHSLDLCGITYSEMTCMRFVSCAAYGSWEKLQEEP